MKSNVPISAYVSRRGIALLEVTLSAAALAIVAVSVVQATVGLDRARAASERLDYASRELENSLKAFTNHSPADVTQAIADQWQLSADVAQQLPGARLTTVVTDELEPAAKRVTMKLHLPERKKPLVLTRWVMIAEPREQEVQP